MTTANEKLHSMQRVIFPLLFSGVVHLYRSWSIPTSVVGTTSLVYPEYTRNRQDLLWQEVLRSK